VTHFQIHKWFFRGVITVLLATCGWWMFQYNWRQRPIANKAYRFTAQEANRLQAYPRAQYQYGQRAWFQNDLDEAAGYFRRAVTSDVLYLDAWHRLAEVAAAAGRQRSARDILAFTTGLTRNVYRWKWQQMLLARELGDERVFFQNANYLLSHEVLEQDALQLLHSYFGGDEEAVAGVLETAHWEAYLKWLMRWSMVDKTLTIWQRLMESQLPDTELGLKYAHFLLHQKRIKASWDIWRRYRGGEQITNPGFESDITQRGFDWRFRNERSENWQIRRVSDTSHEGDYALKIDFKGRENVSFHHLYQIIAAESLAQYRLSYAWKGSNITTDQGLFVEVSSYDSKGLYTVGPLMVGSSDWRQEVIEFTLPENSQAAIIRLRRRPSHRFDNKISGTLWVDDFRIERLSPELADRHPSD
jgi:hypothetical protein